LIDVSGKGAGEVHLVGVSLNIIDGSAILVQNRGIQTAGDINLQAKSIILSGGIADTQIRSSLINETIAGDSGNININTDSLSILDGAAIFTRTFNLGNSGWIDINATESIDVIGVSAINPSQYSVIASNTFSEGNAGNIKLSTKNLSVLNSGIISATTFNNGSAGNITINSENTQVAGKSQGIFRATVIAGVTFGEGDAGSVTFNTQTLSVRDSASVATTSYNSGYSGSITVNATKFIEVAGGDEIQAANINSSVLSDSSPLAQLLGLPLVPSGNAGDITLSTPFLKLKDYGSVTVRNAGTGNAGTLKINADLIKIENRSGLAALSNSTGGGDIFVQADSLQMRRNSYINTDTRGEGNGGNITIDTNTLVALENSDITANAQNSFGGNVTINAEGIFGTQFREKPTEESDITASSKLGAAFSGEVELNTPGIDPNSGITELPANIMDSSSKIASGCTAQTGNTFLVTGRGGIPKNPSHNLIVNSLWSDIRTSTSGKRNDNASEVTTILSKPTIVEATAFIRNENGEIEIVAAQNTPFKTQVTDCSGINT
ncbi:MAG: S-layer family protein, partial [Rivularia sp. (in: cyanobacteria)]